MRILMMTNTYTPYTGGVERSIQAFSRCFREMGHSVLIIAPKTDMPVDDNEDEVFRVSAIKNFNDTNFPITIPFPGALASRLEEFDPEIVHSHFPFIIGSTAMRVAASYEIPLVFTYHTMYERYIHYVNADSDRMRKFVKALAAGYANLCDLVIAPSQAVKEILLEREVESPIQVIPTGVDVQKFTVSDGHQIRQQYRIPKDSVVVGYVGRLASEKNLLFLADAVSRFLTEHKKAHFLIVGDGPERAELESFFFEHDLNEKVVLAGVLEGQALIDSYYAMDLFVFSSKTETQGMVLTEAMAAGLPVVALKASGVTDVLRDGENGFMVQQEDAALFARKIDLYFNSEKDVCESMKQKARRTAESLSIDACAGRVLDCYQKLIQSTDLLVHKDETVWQTATDLIKAEWDIFCNYLNAFGDMIILDETDQE